MERETERNLQHLFFVVIVNKFHNVSIVNKHTETLMTQKKGILVEQAEFVAFFG